MRDLDRDISRSLERLTSPNGDAAETGELWEDLVGRRRRRRARIGALAAVPVVFAAAVSFGVLSGSADDSSSNVAAEDGAFGEAMTAEEGSALGRCNEAVTDLAAFEVELVDVSVVTSGDAAELAERFHPLEQQPWSGMPDDAVVVRCDLRVGRPSPGSNTVFVGPEAFVLLGPDGVMTSHSPSEVAGPSPSESCVGTERPIMPTPEMEVDGEMIPLGLVSVTGCGIEADGALNIGADPAVATVGNVVRLHASSEYRVLISVAGYEDAAAPDEDVAEVADGIFEIELAGYPCGLLTVTLDRDDMSGRFASLLEVADGDCREAVGNSATSVDETSRRGRSESPLRPDEPTPPPTGGLDPERHDELDTDDAEAIVSGFLRLADERSADAVDGIPFADLVRLGVGGELTEVRARAELADPAAWLVDVEGFRARVGPFSALELAANAEATVVSVGEHPHCAGPPVPPPPDVASHARVSVQPDVTGESCLQWWTVDLFVDASGQIEAVTLDLWEP